MSLSMIPKAGLVNKVHRAKFALKAPDVFMDELRCDTSYNESSILKKNSYHKIHSSPHVSSSLLFC